MLEGILFLLLEAWRTPWVDLLILGGFCFIFSALAKKGVNKRI